MATIIPRTTQKGLVRYQVKIRQAGFPATSKTFKTFEDAKKWAKAQEVEQTQVGFIDRSKAEKETLAGVLTRYLAEEVPTHKGHEAETYRINTLLKTRMAEHKLTAVTPELVTEWIEARKLQGVVDATIRRELDILSAVFTHALKAWHYHGLDNPVARLKRPAPAKARTRRFNSDEQARLLLALQDHALKGADKAYRRGSRNQFIRLMVELAIETAMRQGEILALQWENVHGRVAHLPDTKNGDSRDVPLSSKAKAILDGLKPEGEESPTGRVFPITKDAAKKAWQRALARARKDYELECKTQGKVPDNRLLDLRYHDLRHEATSRIAPKLKDFVELSAVTGHRDPRQLKRYYHPDMQSLADKLD